MSSATDKSTDPFLTTQCYEKFVPQYKDLARQLCKNFGVVDASILLKNHVSTTDLPNMFASMLSVDIDDRCSDIVVVNQQMKSLGYSDEGKHMMKMIDDRFAALSSDIEADRKSLQKEVAMSMLMMEKMTSEYPRLIMVVPDCKSDDLKSQISKEMKDMAKDTKKKAVRAGVRMVKSAERSIITGTKNSLSLVGQKASNLGTFLGGLASTLVSSLSNAADGTFSNLSDAADGAGEFLMKEVVSRAASLLVKNYRLCCICEFTGSVVVSDIKLPVLKVRHCVKPSPPPPYSLTHPLIVPHPSAFIIDPS